LERFARERGGSIVLAPDRRLEGAARELWPSRLRERVFDKPVPLATRFPLTRPAREGQREGVTVESERASVTEVLVALDLPPVATTLAAIVTTIETDPVVVRSPLGRGHVYLDGTMDAWRGRTVAGRAYDALIVELLHDAVSRALPAIGASLSRPLARPEEIVTLEVRLRDLEAAGRGQVPVSALIDETPVRLWPASEIGVFRGDFRTPVEGHHRVTVSASSSTIEIPFVSAVSDLATPGDPAALALVAAVHGGRTHRAGQLDALADDIRRTLELRRELQRIRPMRSAWWIVPFAGCLCLEWWSRRRRGLR
jgi:hypothetical protein